MVIGQTIKTTEVLVIGAGPGGYVAAIRAAQLGYDVTLVDKAGELGGLCLHHGCIPTKTLIHAVHLYHTAANASQLGINLQGTIDFPKTQQWKRSVVQRLASGIGDLCKKHGIGVVKGTARFVNPNQVMVEGENLEYNTIEFRYCIIATGSRPRAFPGLSFGGRVLSSREAIELETPPQSLCVIGGGYIGIEIGKMFRKAGSAVTVLESTPHILSVIEPELGEVAHERLKSLNVEVVTETKPENIRPDAEGVTVAIKGQDRRFSHLLVAIGHAPYSEGLGLEAASLHVDEHGFLAVDKQCRTNVRHIYAVGDITGGMMLAHKASAQGKVAAEAIAGKPSAFEPACIPAVVFTDPEIGTVGLREEEARKQYPDCIVVKFPFSALGKAHVVNETKGFVKFVTTKEGLVLGVHAAGPGVTDYIAEAALAIEFGATAEDIAATIHPHPTLGESMAEAAEAILGRAIHLYQARK
jgi:dihydrolipoamide dehydrogenase